MKIKNFPFYIYLFPILSVLTLYSNNSTIVSSKSYLITQLMALVLFQLIYTFINFIKKDSRVSGFITFFISIIFFSYGHIYQIIIDEIIAPRQMTAKFKRSSLIVTSQLNLHIGLTIFSILLIIGLYFFFKKREKIFLNFHQIANKTTSVLLFVSLINAIVTISSSNIKDTETEDKISQSINSEMPDIYYFILDSHGRHDILSKYYKHDNSSFLNGLKDRGFYVSDKSHSNYYWTFLSLSSSLNYDYHQENIKHLDEKSKDLSYLYNIIRNNKISKFLREKSYKILHFKST